MNLRQAGPTRQYKAGQGYIMYQQDSSAGEDTGYQV